MKVELKEIHSPDIPDLSTYVPENETNFGFMLQLFVGPVGESASELFTATVCTPSWLNSRIDEDITMWGRHHIFVSKYNYEKLVQRIKNFILTCQGNSWSEVANKIGRIALWEFED